MNRLEGKTALITGAARGLGAAMAQRFAEQGATVIVNDLILEDAQKVAAQVGGHAVAADVSDPAAVTAMFLEVSRLRPRLDILVNNAGISGNVQSEIDETIEKRRKQAEEIAATGRIETFIDRTVVTTDDAWRKMQAVHRCHANPARSMTRLSYERSRRMSIWQRALHVRAGKRATSVAYSRHTSPT